MPLCASASTSGTQQAQTQEQPSSSLTSIADGQGAASFTCCCATGHTYHFIYLANGRHNCSAGVTTPWSVTKPSSCHFSLFNPSYPSTNSSHIHSCFIISLMEQLFVITHQHTILQKTNKSDRTLTHQNFSMSHFLQKI